MIVRPDTDSENRPQLSTDGWGSYRPAIARSFGKTARHGVVIKNYVNAEVGRYAPPDLRRAERINVQGIRRLWTICTSHMERWNLTTRTFMKRFTRLALGFSKKLENLKAATALHIAHYNFCWRLREKGSSGMLRPTPAMEAGIVNELWKIEDLFEHVTQADEHRKSIAKYKRLARKLENW